MAAIMRTVAAALALLALAAPASAAHWTVDAAKSRLGFTVVWTNRPFEAVFNSWKADIDFDPSDLANSHVVATVDLSSEASDSFDNDDGLKGALGFAVDKFPVARFETTRFARLADGSYTAEAKLTIRNVTRPATLFFKLIATGNRARVTGRAFVDRTAFGVGQGEWAASTPVAHLVTVTLDLAATKN